MAGSNIIPSFPDNSMTDLDDLLREYRNKNFSYEEIREFLAVRHGKIISLSTLKRRLTLQQHTDF